MRPSCRLSELRIIELLDDLSSDLDSYVLVEVNNTTRWQHEKARQGKLVYNDKSEKQHWRRLVKRQEVCCQLILEAIKAAY